jgi:hypothetical protein
MAKRKANARTRKAARKAKKTASRKPVKSARKAAAPTRRRRNARKVRAAVGKKAPGKAAARKAAVRPVKSRAHRPKPAALQRERRRLREVETIAGAPSQLGYASKASGAESGHAMYKQRKREHTEGGSALTGGDIDTDWGEAYASGEETPGGDMPTPDQDVVEEIGRALGVEYEDSEELKGAEKIEERDKHRWEYDPASAEDYKDRNRKD